MRREIVHQPVAARGIVEAAGQPLAPGDRPQPGEVDHIDVGFEQVRGACQGRAGSVEVHGIIGVDQDHIGEPQQRLDGHVLAVGRPDDRRQLGDQDRVDDRVDPARMLSAPSAISTDLAQDADPLPRSRHRR